MTIAVTVALTPGRLHIKEAISKSRTADEGDEPVWQEFKLVDTNLYTMEQRQQVWSLLQIKNSIMSCLWCGFNVRLFAIGFDLILSLCRYRLILRFDLRMI